MADTNKKPTNKAKADDEPKFKPGDVTEYPEGDADAGRIDPEEQAECITAEQKTARDRRAYLIQQGERNEAANDELNAIQVEQNKNLQFVQSNLQDPDVMRETSMEQAKAQLDMHDPEKVRAGQDARRTMRREARLRARGFKSTDAFIAGSQTAPAHAQQQHSQTTAAPPKP